MTAGRPGETPAKRLSRVALAATAGLVVGTAVQVASGWDAAPAAGAAGGAIVAVLVNRLPGRGR